MKEFIALLLAIALAGAISIAGRAEPEPDKNHAIIFTECGKPIGVLLTSDPPRWVSEQYPAAYSTRKLLRAAEENSLVGIVELPCTPKTNT